MMKVITIKEPHASLITNGYKNYEFRNWNTLYRGKLLIHTSAKPDKNGIMNYKNIKINYKYSRIIGEVELVNCFKIDGNLVNEIKKENPKLKSIPNSGYAWELRNIRKINCDKEFKGKLSFWQVDEKELELESDFYE